MWFIIQDVAESTSHFKSKIRTYSKLFIDKGFIVNNSQNPLLFEFTQIGKEFKFISDLTDLIRNVK